MSEETAEKPALHARQPFIGFRTRPESDRMNRLLAELRYRHRAHEEIARPLAEALGRAHRDIQAAAREIGVPEDVSKFFVVDDRGIAWEDDEWVFDEERKQLVERPPEPEDA